MKQLINSVTVFLKMAIAVLSDAGSASNSSTNHGNGLMARLSISDSTRRAIQRNIHIHGEVVNHRVMENVLICMLEESTYGMTQNVLLEIIRFAMVCSCTITECFECSECKCAVRVDTQTFPDLTRKCSVYIGSVMLMH